MRFPTFTVHLVDSPEKYKMNTATKQLRGMLETQMKLLDGEEIRFMRRLLQISESNNEKTKL